MAQRWTITIFLYMIFTIYSSVRNWLGVILSDDISWISLVFHRFGKSTLGAFFMGEHVA